MYSSPRIYFSPAPGDVPRTSQKLEELVGKYCDYDLHVFGPKAFYPVAWPDWKDIFKVRRENTPGTKETERGSTHGNC